MRDETDHECNEALRDDNAQGQGAPNGPGPRPPALTNRGVSKFQGSEDTIVLSLYVYWDDEWAETIAALEELKVSAADDQAGDGGFFHVGGWPGLVMEYGAGGGNKGPRRTFVIEAVGMRFEFSRTQYPNGETPNGRLIVGSLICMQLGPRGVLSLAKEFIEAMGGRLLENKVSRIDGAVDLPNVEVKEFIDAFRSRQYLCRARKFKVIGEGQNDQTLILGSSPMVRIYDKAREQRDLPDPAKLQFLMANRWGGTFPEHATRVEFQLRRDDVKTITFDGRTINSLEDYLECRAGLWAYLCNWFRLTKEPVDDNHRDRAQTSSRWEEVTRLFAEWASSPVETITRMKPTRPIDERTLNAMLVGCGIGICANDEDFSLQQLKQAILRAIHEEIEKHGVDEIKRRWWIKRQRQLIAMVPETDRRGRSKPKPQSFDMWLAEKDAYRQAVEEAGGQMPIKWSNDPLQFIDFKTIVGE